MFLCVRDDTEVLLGEPVFSLIEARSNFTGAMPFGRGRRKDSHVICIEENLRVRGARKVINKKKRREDTSLRDTSRDREEIGDIMQKFNRAGSVREKRNNQNERVRNINDRKFINEGKMDSVKCILQIKKGGVDKVLFVKAMCQAFIDREVLGSGRVAFSKAKLSITNEFVGMAIVCKTSADNLFKDFTYTRKKRDGTIIQGAICRFTRLKDRGNMRHFPTIREMARMKATIENTSKEDKDRR